MGSPAFTTYPRPPARQQHLTSPTSVALCRSEHSSQLQRKPELPRKQQEVDATHRLSLYRLSTRQYRFVPNATENDLLKNLGRQLRALREQAGKSQDTLANDSGLHRTYIGAVERGERNPTILTLSRYAAGLGLAMSDLVDGF